jgi:hypothetical protein
MYQYGGDGAGGHGHCGVRGGHTTPANNPGGCAMCQQKQIQRDCRSAQSLEQGVEWTLFSARTEHTERVLLLLRRQGQRVPITFSLPEKYLVETNSEEGHTKRAKRDEPHEENQRNQTKEGGGERTRGWCGA